MQTSASRSTPIMCSLYALSMAGLLFAPHAMPQCLVLPIQKAKIDVVKCENTTIKANPANSWHKPGSSVAGLLISGKVVGSELTWEGTQAYGRMENHGLQAWKPGEVKTMFVDGRQSGDCGEWTGKTRNVQSTKPCCDNFPTAGLCIVPHPVIEASDGP